MADRKITELTEANTVAANDYFLVVSAPDSQPLTKKVRSKNILNSIASNLTVNNANISVTNGSISTPTLYVTDHTTPTLSTDTVTIGKIWFDANYLYVATANNSIKRIALTSF